MSTNLSRLTSALQRNEELTKELEAIVQVSSTICSGRLDEKGRPPRCAPRHARSLAANRRVCVQNTTRSLIEYSGAEGGAAVPAAASGEPEFHASLDMGKVRLNVSVPGGTAIVVPCDHRQTVADVTAKIRERSGKDVAALMVRTRPPPAGCSPRALAPRSSLRVKPTFCLIIPTPRR